MGWIFIAAVVVVAARDLRSRRKAASRQAARMPASSTPSPRVGTLGRRCTGRVATVERRSKSTTTFDFGTAPRVLLANAVRSSDFFKMLLSRPDRVDRRCRYSVWFLRQIFQQLALLFVECGNGRDFGPLCFRLFGL